MVSQDAVGRSGWSYTGEHTKKSDKCGVVGSVDAFSDGTCNPPGTPYMIQTGYAISALSQLYIVTRHEAYLKVAQKAAKDSWNIGVVPASCPKGYYYWYSYHENDYDRYVRNTNMIMAEGLAWLHAATGDAALKARVLSLVEAEACELKNKNFGYFGKDDPRFISKPALESQRIENHMGHQIKALKDVAILLKQPKLMEYASELLHAYMGCANERCKPGHCESWAAPLSCKSTWTITPCILGDANPAFDKQCSQALGVLGNLTSFQKFMSAPESAVRKYVP